MTQRWIAVQAKPMAVGRVYLGIEASGWKAFCPFEVKRYVHRGQIMRNFLTVFGDYVFVLIEPPRMHALLEVPGVVCILRDPEGKPGFVSEERIAEVRRMRDMGGFDETRDDWAAVGEDVKLADSAFFGLQAKIKRAQRHKRIELVLEGGPFSRVTTSIDKLEKIRA